jgi:1-acyl-sn-glycerol-3-phosphate acyltransferase
MLRTLWLAVVALVMTLICAPAVTIVALLHSHAEAIDRIIHFWARGLVWGAGIELSIVGQDKLDPTKRYIVVANHASYLDIPCLIAAVRQPLRFMAKASLFRVPIFGWGLRTAGFIPIDRKKSGQAKALFDLAARRIQGGNSIIIFPEGGRSRSKEMQPWKHGAFLLSMKSGLPLVPTAIRGNDVVMPATTLKVRPGPVQIVIGDPIETKDLSVRQKEELMAGTRATIEQMLQ